jgi:reverse gyrase
MDLVVVESGAKAKTIQKYLGKNILVRASNGHVQDLPNKGKDGSKALWKHTESALPNPPWGWTERAEKNIKKILSDARSKKVKRVLIATDPDREGEFIAWRLSELFSEFKEIKRITFNEITKTAIRDALDEAGSVDMNLVDAAKVRRFMDRLIGYRASRFARSWSLSSMGRVQTPALAASTRFISTEPASSKASLIAVLVISLKVILLISLNSENNSLSLQAMNSPSRSGSVAISTLLTFLLRASERIFLIFFSALSVQPQGGLGNADSVCFHNALLPSLPLFGKS